MQSKIPFHTNIYIPEQFLENQILFTVFYFFKWDKQEWRC